LATDATVTGGASVNTVQGARANDGLLQAMGPIGGFKYTGDTLYGYSPDADLLPSDSSINVTIIGNITNGKDFTMIGDAVNSNSNLFISGYADSLGTVFIDDTIIGGAGSDTLFVGAAGDLADSQFANATGVNALSLNGGGNAVTLGGNADTLAGFETIQGGIGNDKVTFDNVNGILPDDFTTILGGAGTDTIGFTGGSLSNPSLANISGFDVLSLTGGSNDLSTALSIDNQFDTIVGGSGSSTVNASAYTGPNAVYFDTSANTIAGGLSWTGGAGNDTFVVANDTIIGGTSFGATADSTLNGGDGTDTLRVGTAGTYEINFVNNVSLIEVLELTGASSVEFIPFAATGSVGFDSIIGGTGASTIDAHIATNAIYIQGANNQADRLIGGDASDTLQGFTTAAGNTTPGANDTLTGGSASDYFILASGVTDAYGSSPTGPVAYITGFDQAGGDRDYLDLADPTGASYSAWDAASGGAPVGATSGTMYIKAGLLDTDNLIAVVTVTPGGDMSAVLTNNLI
jgi:Ca2+-binding RTX toxin-like protein